VGQTRDAGAKLDPRCMDNAQLSIRKDQEIDAGNTCDTNSVSSSWNPCEDSLYVGCDILRSGHSGSWGGLSQTEFQGYGEWTDGKIRVDKTEEGVQLILKLWQEAKVDF
jgi:hypothetical protein